MKITKTNCLNWRVDAYLGGLTIHISVSWACGWFHSRGAINGAIVMAHGPMIARSPSKAPIFPFGGAV